MKYPITLELLLRDEARGLLDGMCELLRTQVVFFAADGRILKRGRGEANSAYCTLMQQGPFSLDHCLKLDAARQRECARRGDAVCYRCHAGLNEIIAPVTVCGHIAGFIVFGQFRSPGPPPECAAGSPAALRAYRKLPVFTAHKTAGLAAILKMLIDYIVARELVRLPADLKLPRLKHYLERDLTRKTTLAQAAKFLACSESSLTHYLHDVHGTSFKRLLAAIRLDAAEALMRNSPELTLAEVAQRSGYDDPHYFSRVYKRMRGRTPLEFRRGPADLQKSGDRRTHDA